MDGIERFIKAQETLWDSEPKRNRGLVGKSGSKLLISWRAPVKNEISWNCTGNQSNTAWI